MMKPTLLPPKTRLLEIRLGRRAPLAASGLISAIDKQPVDGPVDVGPSALAGDEYGAPDLHGGAEQVILHYPLQHYAHWRREFPHRAERLRAGGFGENFVADGFDESNLCIGDVVAVGGVRLQVSMPRQPCERLNHRFDIADMATAVQQSRRTGWYYRVLTPGPVRADDAMEVIERPHPQWPLSRVQACLYDDTNNVAAMQTLSTLDALAPLMRELFARRLAERATGAAGGAAPETWLPLRVDAVTQVSSTVRSCLLSSLDGAPLPAAAPGAHIGVRLPGGLLRQYSLCPAPQPHQYRIAVAWAADSRGGSRWLHETLSPGDVLQCSPPRDGFPVAPHASRHVMFAGGIGITPFLSMVDHFEAHGQAYHLYYLGRRRTAMAFADELRARCGEHLTLHITDEAQGRRLDIAAAVAGLPADAHVYCCGPQAMVEAVEAASNGLPPGHLHIEKFAAPANPGSDRSYSVFLAQRGLWLDVAPGRSLLASLRAHGVAVPSSCETGSCGTCVLPYREGDVMHRDSCLTESARQSRMAACVSCARSDSIVLDL